LCFFSTLLLVLLLLLCVQLQIKEKEGVPPCGRLWFVCACVVPYSAGGQESPNSGCWKQLRMFCVF
jgi:hypothetical protein